MIGYWRDRRKRVGVLVIARVVLAVVVFVAGVAGLAGSGRAAIVYSTSTSVGCQPASVVVGSASVCTATVTDAISGGATPTGSVSFTSDSPGSFSGGGSCALAPTATAGIASCEASYTPSAVASGTHTITASYGGDSIHYASHGTTTVAVAAASTSTSVGCQPTSVVVGNASVCTATVTDTISRGVTPTASVSFTSDSPGSFGGGGSCALTPTSTPGIVSCQSSYTPSAVGSGTHTITASYGGDSDRSASHGTTTVAVGAGQTLTVSLVGTGSGTVTGSGISCPGSCSNSYPSDTPVSLTATPAVGSIFTGWSGCARTGTGTCSVTMSVDQTVSATFSDTQSTCAHVSTRQQLIDALAAGYKCIFVDNNAQIDLAQVSDNRAGAPNAVLHIPDGVTIESGRSPTVQGGLLYMSHRIKQEHMLDLGSNTHITGLRLRGYNQWDTTKRQDRTEGIAIDGKYPVGDPRHVVVNHVLIDNNEIYGWPDAAVAILSAERDAGSIHDRSIHITGNFIHNNIQCDHGYGVLVSGSGFAVVDRNVFDWDRHDVSSDGGSGTGYLAELNFLLTHGKTCDGYYNQHFDVHGQYGGYGGTAGNVFVIGNNTIRGNQDVGAGLGVRPAFELRGTPLSYAIFHDNALEHDDESDAIDVRSCPHYPCYHNLDADQLKRERKLFVYGNRYKVWTARDLAVGNFGNDGCSDVFQATGAVWVYSPCGRGIWRFLNQSSLRLDRLAFGDFNGDGKTDVFSQSGDQWLVSHGGTGPWTPLPAGSNIPMKEYRFGNFDGDRKTDIFRANGSRFYYSDGGATAWKPLAFSHLKIDELRFGEFQRPGRTDVFSLANGQWSVSYGGATRWQRLNSELSSNLGELAFADFDGDGRTDIARCHDGKAEVSWNGTTPWRPLGFACQPGFPGMLFGKFSGGKRADVLAAGSIGSNTLNRYWLSSGGKTAFVPWSIYDML